MPYSIRPSEHKPFQADTARWKNFRSRLTVWHYRMSSVLHQGVHGYVKIIPMLPSSVVWLVGFFGSWRCVVCQGRICESNWKHQHVWYSSAYILRWTYMWQYRLRLFLEGCVTNSSYSLGKGAGMLGRWETGHHFLFCNLRQNFIVLGLCNTFLLKVIINSSTKQYRVLNWLCASLVHHFGQNTHEAVWMNSCGSGVRIHGFGNF